MIRLIKKWYRLDYRTRSRITLITVVGIFLMAVVIADQLALTNHP